MTDATRDAIAKAYFAYIDEHPRIDDVREFSDAILSALLAAPESVQLDLARRLLPTGYCLTRNDTHDC